MQLPAHDFLDRLGLPYRRMSFPPATAKGAANVARALGFRERQMIKTLIFETDRGERLLVMVGGDQNVVSGLLKKAAGSRNIRLASADARFSVRETRIAIVAEDDWLALLTWLESLFLEAEIKVFDSEEEALSWLKEGRNERGNP